MITPRLPGLTILVVMSASPPDPPGFRISDADRERAAGRLQRALAEGRITVAELEERLAVVYAARYERDLLPPLADLPPESGPEPVPVTPAGPPMVLRAGGASSIRRTGDWAVPPRLRVQTRMGSVLLDFCDAINPHPVVEIELETAVGSVRLLLPDDATANIDDVVTMGSVRSSVPSRPRPGSPHFVVHGRIGMGSVRVRRRYRFAGRSF